jgi:hypothetical protein
VSSKSLSKTLGTLDTIRQPYRLGIYLVLGLLGGVIGLAIGIEPMLAAPALLGMLLLPLAARKPHLVVLTIAVYTPFEDFFLKWIPAQQAELLRLAPEAVLILLLGLLVLRNLGEGILWRRTPLDLPVLCFLAFSAASALVNDVPSIIWVLGIREFARYIILYYVVVNARLSERFVKTMIVILLAMALLEAIIAVMQSILGVSFTSLFVPSAVSLGGTEIRPGFTQILSRRTRVFGTLGRYGRLGFFLVVFLLLASGLYLSQRSRLKARSKWGLLFFFALACSALALSFSRTSWFALYAGIMVLLLFSGRIRLLLLAALLPVVATVVLVSQVQLETWAIATTEEASLTDRYVATFSSGYLDALMEHGRVFILTEVAPVLLRDYPWLGLGPGTMGSIATGAGTSSAGYMSDYSHEDLLAINDPAIQRLHDVGWVAMLAQVGLLGVLAYLWIFAQLGLVAFYCLRKSSDQFYRGFALGYLALIAAIVLGNFAMFVLSFRAISMYLWLFGGLLTTCYHRLSGISSMGTQA